MDNRNPKIKNKTSKTPAPMQEKSLNPFVKLQRDPAIDAIEQERKWKEILQKMEEMHRD